MEEDGVRDQNPDPGLSDFRAELTEQKGEVLVEGLRVKIWIQLVPQFRIRDLRYWNTLLLITHMALDPANELRVRVVVDDIEFIIHV